MCLTCKQKASVVIQARAMTDVELSDEIELVKDEPETLEILLIEQRKRRNHVYQNAS
jgi:hypothetical protein